MMKSDEFNGAGQRGLFPTIHDEISFGYRIVLKINLHQGRHGVTFAHFESERDRSDALPRDAGILSPLTR